MMPTANKMITHYTCDELACAFEDKASNGLALFNKLDSSIKKELLMKKMSYGLNVLMYAISHRPNAVEPLLTALEALNLDDQGEVLGQCNRVHNAHNALAIAAVYNDAFVPMILNAIKKLDEPDKKKILTSFGMSGELGRLGWTDSLVLSTFNLMVENLEPEKVYDSINASFNNDFPIYHPQILRYKLLGDMGALVARLTSSDKNETIRNLGTDLQKNLDTYKSSEKTVLDLNEFKTAWNSKIKKARTTDAIKGQPDVMGVLKTMLLVLSVIGIVFLSYQANENKKINRSMFFPSTNEKIVNAMQDIANTLETEPPPSLPNKSNEL